MKTRRSRAVAIAVAVLLVAACSRTIDVPREQFDASSKKVDHTHSIWTLSGDEYRVESFQATDSSLVISALNRSDPRHAKAGLPISIPLDSVKTVQRIDHRPPTWVIVGTVGAFVLVAALLSDGEAFTD